MKPEDVEKHIDAIWKSVESSAEKMTRIYGPAWSVKSDLAKILITVSSALLAALMAFSQEVFKDVADYLLYLGLFGMCGLLLVVVASIVALYTATGLTSFQENQFKRLAALREKLAAMDESSTNFDSELDKYWRPMLIADLEPIGNAAKKSGIFLNIAATIFVISLLGFLVFVAGRYVCA